MRRLFLLLALLPVALQAAPAKPNILIIVADDAGFSDLGCYGSEIRTPHLDALAANGLRFTQFYNTARCWPTRAALMTGYYPQQVGQDPARGYFPAWTRTMPQHLKPAGYRAYHSGKWHIQNAPRVCADAGFDHSYKLDDHDRHFTPKRHTLDDQPLPPVEEGTPYYTTTAIADYAIRWLREHADKHAAEPFLTYLAFTSPHFPIQAPAEDIARYEAAYAQGWEKTRAARYERQKKMGLVTCALSQPEPQVRAASGKPDVLDHLGAGETLFAVPWDSLTAEQKKFQAKKEAIHAAMIDRIDREVGRVIAQLKAMGSFENTIIFFLSDNGASAEIMVRGDGHDQSAEPGSAHSFLCLGPGGSTVSNTPFRRHKIWTHEGGIATPLIVHWPAGVPARGELRHDPGHVVDLLPTLLEITGAPRLGATRAAPAFPGRSLAPAFAKDGAAPRDYLFFHHEGNRALRLGDHKIVSAIKDGATWELYDLAKDRGETENLAAKDPARTGQMAARWEQLSTQFTADAGPEDPSRRPRKAKPPRSAD